MPDVPIGVRLSRYGLDQAQASLTDLKVAAGTEVVLSPKNRELAKNMKELHPTSMVKMKEWLGTPVVRRIAQPYGVLPAMHALIPRSGIGDFHTVADILRPLPARLTPAHTSALYAAAHQYVMTDHAVEPEVVANLDKWLAMIKPSIIFFHFADIHVAAGAKLVLGTSNSILFARNITVEKTGKIVAKATVVKIDCAGIKGN